MAVQLAGVPCIYYGDEVGVDGNNDPFCRKPFPWDPALQDTQLLALYQRMAKLRKAHQALRYGGCQVIYAEDNVVVFVRVYKQQRVLVVINRGEACEVVIEDSPLLNVAGWTLQEGAGAFQDGVLTSRPSPPTSGPAVNGRAGSAGRRGGAPPATSAEPAHHSRCARPYR